MTTILENKRKLASLAFLLLLLSMSGSVLAQSLALDDPALPLSGETLDGVKIKLPEATQGKITFLALAFSKGAGGRTRQWTDRFWHDFDNDPKVTWYSVKMYGGMRAFVRNVTVMNLRRGTGPKFQPHYLIIDTPENQWKQSLGADDSGIAYVLLLDTKGKIAWMARGKPTLVNYESLKAKIKELEVTQSSGF